ncbi:hypothetical protein DFH07DRAFT_758929 [Mycena maculata]|uniref:Hydrophobin n=1 Tax=Mycena maculata TaxID=230809 RepID=A0AAD7HNG5_9AGAR|nr:hypothetical protein DFH07DRAFT_758929 [Mycena maculata]
MKVAVVLAFLSLTFSSVDAAVPRDTNARRLARGLPPLKPVRREAGTFTLCAKRSSTSSTPFQCQSKQTFCCSNFESASSPAATNLLSGLGIQSSSCGEQIGTGCVAISGDSWYVFTLFGPLHSMLTSWAPQLFWHCGYMLWKYCRVRPRWCRLHEG